MNAGIFIFAMSTPLKVPSTAPSSRMRMTDGKTPIFGSSRVSTQEQSATCEATDRSRSPLMMTKVMPTPQIPVKEASRTMFWKAEMFRKLGLNTMRISQKMSSA